MIQRFLRLYRQEGMAKAIDETRWFLQRGVVRRVSDVYWRLRGGTQQLTIGDTTATFDATSDHGGDTVRWMHDAERPFLTDLVENISDDDVFLDIGANIGIFTCFAAVSLSSEEVVAFEPYPPNVAQLRRNLSYNVSDSRFSVVDVALPDSQGSIESSAPNSDPGNQTACIDPDTDVIEVKSFPGDQLVADGTIPAPSVAKIDVEGAEPLVIRGLEDALASETCRALYCEIHLPREGARPSVEDYGESRESMLEMITNLAFDIEYNEQRGSEIHVKAVK